MISKKTLDKLGWCEAPSEEFFRLQKEQEAEEKKAIDPIGHIDPSYEGPETYRLRKV